MTWRVEQSPRCTRPGRLTPSPAALPTRLKRRVASGPSKRCSFAASQRKWTQEGSYEPQERREGAEKADLYFRARCWGCIFREADWPCRSRHSRSRPRASRPRGHNFRP
jgi:hypothetical protein